MALAEPATLRIAHALPAGANPHSGVPTVVMHLAAQLARRGHSVEVWFLQPLSDVERAVYEPVLLPAGVTMVRPASAGLRSVGPLLRRRVDVVHLHSVFTPLNSVLAARLAAPYVVSPHGGYAPVSRQRSRLRKTLYWTAIEQRLVRRAALRVALTGVEATDMVAYGAGMPIAIIPNGVAPPPADVDRRAFRLELGLDDATPLLVFVGRLDVFHKGLDRLVEGLAGAPRWRAALIGSDVRGGRDWVLSAARARGVLSRLACVGPRHGRALHEALAAANLFMLPSRWEGLPVSLLEALSHGVPALVTPPVEAAVAVAAAGAGWLAAPPEIGRVLSQLSDLDREGWLGASTAARRLAECFEWATIARQYEAAYVSCLRR